jgi:hypothetical protein
MHPNVSSNSDSRRRSLPNVIPPGPESVFRHVIGCVARDFGVAAEILAAPTRGAPRVALARQAAMYLLHVDHALSCETIGRMFGRDRTTVSHACRVIEDSRDDIWLDCRLAALELACNGNKTSKRSSPQSSRRPR